MLLIYNTSSADSAFAKNYSLAHWRKVAQANVLMRALHPETPFALAVRPRVKFVSALSVFFGSVILVNAQMNFQNFDFESAAFVPVPGDPLQRFYPSAALPGWTGYVGANPLDAVLYNGTYISSSGMAILGSDYVGGFPGRALDGRFSLLLEAGAYLDHPAPADVSLSQNGLVPDDARSLRFVARSTVGASFAVSLGGVNLSLISFPAATNSTRIYAADVSTFAGSAAPLKFTVFSPGLSDPPGMLLLDSIEFSPTAVPEPSTWALISLGGIALGVARLRGWIKKRPNDYEERNDESNSRT